VYKRQALQSVVGELPQLAATWLRRDRFDGALGPLEKRLADAPCARSCIEGALLDLLAQRRGAPLADCLRDHVPPAMELPVNALIAGKNAEELAEAASQLVTKGWHTFKVKIAGDPATEAAKLATLRKWVGEKVRIRADVNGMWNREQAARFCNLVEEVDLEYLEQPLPAEDLDGVIELRKRTRIPIALDEGVRCAADVARIASRQAADLIVLKPQALGGWRPTRQAAELARSTGMEVVFTTFMEGSVGRALSIHFAAALGCTGRAQGLATGSLLRHDLTDSPIKVRHGLLMLPGTPGLGVGSLLPEIVIP